MPDFAKIYEVTAWEDTGVSLMARVEGTDGANIQQADVSSIAYSVYDITTLGSSSEATSGSLTVSDVVYDTLQTDNRWDRDTTGYNFRHDVAAATLAAGGKIYRAEYKFTPASGEAYHVVFEIKTKNLYRS